VGQENRYTLFKRLKQAAIAIVGLVFIVLGAVVELKLGVVDFSAALVNTGLFIVTILVIQWTLDEKVRKALVEDAVARTVSAKVSVLSGFQDIQEDSRNLDASNLMESAATVDIGFNYSTALFERLEPKIISRSERGLRTRIVMIDPDGECINGVLSNQDNLEFAIRSIEKIKADIISINADYPGTVEVFYHNSVLKFGFLASDRDVWIIIYSNDRDTKSVPALCLGAAPVNVQGVVRRDINGLIAHSRLETWN